MALIKCSECGQEVSDKAPACPHCGNPISPKSAPAMQVSIGADNPIQIEPILTSKRWKLFKLISWGIAVVGIIFWLIIPGSTRGFGFGFAVAGVISSIVAHVGAWYSDRRTR